jgi:glutathione peroxidase
MMTTDNQIRTGVAIPPKRESFKQKILRKMYPLIRAMGKKGRNGTILTNEKRVVPPTSFYDLKAELNGRKPLEFSDFRGKKVIIVNTASDCGYTGQYSELQSLHEQFGDALRIIAFPANDFAGQEKGSDSEIAGFCQVNYGVTFPVALKGVVLKNAEQQAVYKWLTDKNLNGWNEHAPDWNFGKYIVDENGILTHYYGPSISPLDNEFLGELE